MQKRELPAELRGTAFRVSDALESGVAAHRLRALDLRSPHSGLRSTGETPTDLLTRCLELVPLLGEGRCFSHITAAQLWGLLVPLGTALHDTNLHVTSTGPTREPRRPGITGHRSADALVMNHLGVPIVSPLRAWGQCAETFGIDDLVIMGDALVSKWSPHRPARFRTLRQLAQLVQRWEGRRGALALREALALVRLRSWSPKETELRLFIVRCGRLEPPELNRRMYAADGSYLGRPDLAYRDRKIGIEYEGDYHRVSASTFRSDIARRERFADEGWRTLRVTGDDLASPAELESRCRRFLPPAA
jgi:very-short-patch-repair endonuclease